MRRVTADCQFGRWTVISRSSKRKVICRCDCGTIKEVYVTNLTSGKSVSCGCFAKEANRKRMSTHGESKTKLYGVWLSMNRRCDLKTSNSYRNYGARGITVCGEWKESFENFKNWATANGYKNGLTIDRKENDKGYAPDNCRWVDRVAQGCNKRNNFLITINGITHTASEWRRITGMPRGTIEGRFKRGWKGEKLLVPSHIGNNQFTHF